MQTNIVNDFVQELLEETGFDKSNQDQYKALLASYEDRVNSRLLLEIIYLLTPEQASLLKKEMDSTKPKPEELFAKIAEQIPGFGNLLLQILTKIRQELLADLQELVVKKV